MEFSAKHHKRIAQSALRQNSPGMEGARHNGSPRRARLPGHVQLVPQLVPKGTSLLAP
jgi:hypothetical protein